MMGERSGLQCGLIQLLWKRERFADYQLRKEEPPALSEGFNYVLRLGAYSAKRCANCLRSYAFALNEERVTVPYRGYG